MYAQMAPILSVSAVIFLASKAISAMENQEVGFDGFHSGNLAAMATPSINLLQKLDSVY